MSGPNYPLIKGAASGTPGTGAFTPTSLSGYRAWSNVPAGWMGLVKFEDGATWELAYCYWNGTTLSRATTQSLCTSVNATPGASNLTLSSSATAALVVDGRRSVPPQQGIGWIGLVPISGVTTTPTAIGCPAATVTGTAAAGTLATTNSLTAMRRIHTASATTANAQAGYSHVAALAMQTGFNSSAIGFVCRFGHSGTLPTGPRLFVGLTGTTLIANTAEPSALVANYVVVAKDSTDTNIQVVTNSNAGAGTKIDTGIALVANGVYEMECWQEPGSTGWNVLLMRLDTGAIFITQTFTDVPASGAALFPQCIGGLSSTTGTAFTLAFGGYALKTGVV